jgi:hypothetical protein
VCEDSDREITIYLPELRQHAPASQASTHLGSRQQKRSDEGGNLHTRPNLAVSVWRLGVHDLASRVFALDVLLADIGETRGGADGR